MIYVAISQRYDTAIYLQLMLYIVHAHTRADKCIYNTYRRVDQKLPNAR